MKKIKFDLPMDGAKVSSIKELQEHFTANEIICHFRSDVLGNWLESRGESTLLAQVEELKGIGDAKPDDAVALRGLCRIFEVDADEATIKAAVAKPAGIPGWRLRTQKEFLEWFVATTHYLSRLVSPRSGIPEFRRVHLGFGLPDPPASTNPSEWSAYVVEFINHCHVVIEVLKSCPDRELAETIAGYVSDHVDRVLDCFDGMTRKEYDDVPAEVHVEDMQPPMRMAPVGYDVRTSSRTRITDLQWSSAGEIDKAGEVDWWCFTVLRPGKVTVQTTGNLDTVGLLEDCSGLEKDRNDDGGRERNFKIVCTLGPGTYYIRVSAFGEATGIYTLDVRHTRHSRTDGGDDRTPSTASIHVNQSISRARAIGSKYRQEVLRSLSTEHLQELTGIAYESDINEAGWDRAWPIIQWYLKESTRAPENAEDGGSKGAVLGVGVERVYSGFFGIKGGHALYNPRELARRQLTDEQKTALEAFGDALQECEMRLVQRIGGTGLFGCRSRIDIRNVL